VIWVRLTTRGRNWIVLAPFAQQNFRIQRRKMFGGKKRVIPRKKSYTKASNQAQNCKSLGLCLAKN
jgi:hypothetical protein